MHRILSEPVLFAWCHFYSTFVRVQRNMEEYGLESLEDPSDIIEDVVEISVENSVEANLLCMNNEVLMHSLGEHIRGLPLMSP